jgi:hypothetical protein
MKVGDIIKIEKDTSSKICSNNTYLNSNKKFKIVGIEKGTTYTCYHLDDVTSPNIKAGWVYDFEVVLLTVKLEDLQDQLSKAQKNINDLQAKIDWMTEASVTEFDEEEYMVYRTIKLFNDKSLSDLEKSKLIAELIKNK